MIFKLNSAIRFPNTALAEEDGLLAMGGDLSINRLKLAYSLGIFPWYNAEEPILWYCPKQRFVIFPTEIKISKSMRAVLKCEDLAITFNQAFEQVIKNCRTVARKGKQGTWIQPEMVNAYIELYQLGFAKSVEVWKKKELVGGLYGIEIGKVFTGESMFSLQPNMSKVALISLCKTGKYNLIDCQLENAHLASLGGKFISKTAFEDFLEIK